MLTISRKINFIKKFWIINVYVINREHEYSRLC